MFYLEGIRCIGIACIMTPLIGCASMTASYTPPTEQQDLKDYSQVINKPFDEVWKALIQYSASTFFSIDNYEKDSGLITLSFGSSKPSEYVDGGQWSSSNFNGKYVDYLGTVGPTSLDGKMNIIVVPINPEKTQVTVKARYIFTSSVYNTYTHQTVKDIWSFDTGGSDSLHISNPAMGTSSATRTMKPTYKAERSIINAVEALSR